LIKLFPGEKDRCHYEHHQEKGHFEVDLLIEYCLLKEVLLVKKERDQAHEDADA
jgi:hypothetical protein